MSFDSKTTTITAGNSSEFTADSGAFFVKVLRDLAMTPGTPSGLSKDWRIAEDWLGCAGRELTDSDYKAIGASWRSYVARGIAPSRSLEASFEKLSRLAKQEEWETAQLPLELVGVFDRMVATPTAIEEKRAFDAVQFGSFIRNLDGAKQKPARQSGVATRLNRSVNSLSRRGRAAVVLSIAWAIYVIYRTAGDHELVGMSLYRWDDEAFLLNLLLPPITILGGAWLYRWVTTAK